MSDRKNLEDKETILLPKGTILHHYRTRKNKRRSFKWYYLASQKYTSTVEKPTHFCIYETNDDIQLEKYHLCELAKRDIWKIINNPGIYDSKDYTFRFKKYQHRDLRIKNLEQRHNRVPRITFENLITSNEPIEDPLRGLVVKDDDQKTFQTIEYEIILDNSVVTLISKKKIIHN
jgi:hypothetical protein